ncbi:MAG: FHA domain-containing protein [Candidatus Obscuribacterales bacterium]|nr:FHA domain-containing protein [Candidatus Obscuribacterales bacterium]
MNESDQATCNRCGKQYSAPNCPFCTVCGLPFEALLQAERIVSAGPQTRNTPATSLVDVVSGHIYLVNSPICKFGRDQTNNIVLFEDKSVSRFHFQIQFNGQDYYIEDCKSRNGTLLNGQPVRAPRKLNAGDTISAGMGRYIFSLSPADQLELTVTNAPAISTTSPAIPQPEANKTIELSESENPLSRLKARLTFNEHTSANTNPVLPELEKLKQERNRLESLFGNIRAELRTIDLRIHDLQTTWQRLLNGHGYELTATLKSVFELLDWKVYLSPDNTTDILLSDAGQTEAVVRLVSAGEKIDLPRLEKEVAQLTDLQKRIEEKQNRKIKGLLLLQEPDNLDWIISNNEIGLLTIFQILEIYRLVYLHDGNKNYIKQSILSNSGMLKGFELPQETKV